MKNRSESSDDQGKRPAFQFYASDWRTDQALRNCSLEARGFWMELLCLMHESPRRGVLLLPSGEPMNSAEIAKQTGINRRISDRLLATLTANKVCRREPDTGAFFSFRMVKDEHIYQVRRSAGSLGGNPALLKQSLEENGKQKQTPSSSSSSSPSPSSLSQTVPLPVRSSPPQQATGGANERPSATEDYQRFWGPVEKRLRAEVEPHLFAKTYAGIQIVNMTARDITLAVQEFLIIDSGGADKAAMKLESLVGDDFLRGREIRVMSIGDFIGRSLGGKR